MKKIEIKGKHQTDRINKANDPNNKDIIAVRDCMKSLPNNIFEYKYQIGLINKLFLDIEQSPDYKKECLREINKKLASYKTQDINKNRYDETNISQAQAIEKIVGCKLKCFYCKTKMAIFYNKVREQCQWTLDRINNDLSHTNDNVVVCCLQCNLKRRCQNDKKFLFTKQLIIIKNT